MVGHDEGRWDVSTKDNAVHVERISESDERVFNDVLAPEEARKLAGLLTKYADKADEPEESGRSEDDEESEDSDDSKGPDGPEDSEKSEDTDKSEDSDDSEDSSKSSD